ncbi:MAG: glycosyltransferase family 4 protein [Proteobacteria bacterium]|nr:glycosyltransferase family 4 protein [Pseudomonadota bacterium]
MQGKSILLLSRYGEQAASSRLRTLQYLPYLRQAGIDVEVASFFDDRYLDHLYRSGSRRVTDVFRAYAHRFARLLSARRHAVVWVEKEVFPFLSGSFEALLRLARAPWVVDYDDAIFHTYDLHPSAVVRFALGRKLTPLLGGAAAVIAGNSYLESHLRPLGARQLYRIPTVVDVSRYPAAPKAVPRDELRIGWIGSPATSHYLRELKGALGEASRRRRLRLVTIGAGPLDDLGVPIEQHPWSADTEAALLATIDVGIMPLPDGPWENGKCGYKLIQYMAVGRPVIASPVGVNRDIVTPAVGRLASSDEEWARAVVELADDVSLRQMLGETARVRVLDEYSLQSTAPKILQILTQAAGSRLSVENRT